MAVAASPSLPMRAVGVIAFLASVALGPRASLAQVRSIANEAMVETTITASSASALAAWEGALASGIADPDVWSAIGQRLYAAGRYRECIAAFEQALVRRNRQSTDDAHVIAEAYARIGNAKQAARWRAFALGIELPSGLRIRPAVS